MHATVGVHGKSEREIAWLRNVFSKRLLGYLVTPTAARWNDRTHSYYSYSYSRACKRFLSKMTTCGSCCKKIKFRLQFLFQFRLNYFGLFLLLSHLHIVNLYVFSKTGRISNILPIVVVLNHKHVAVHVHVLLKAKNGFFLSSQFCQFVPYHIWVKLLQNGKTKKNFILFC